MKATAHPKPAHQLPSQESVKAVQSVVTFFFFPHPTTNDGRPKEPQPHNHRHHPPGRIRGIRGESPRGQGKRYHLTENELLHKDLTYAIIGAAMS